ncbi:hypothetical protein [Streptomyces niveus]|uniref:hypothetical protein n=1 Tax=Streptomyces niveus TaxID=193462 RepID=UPI00365E47D9
MRRRVDLEHGPDGGAAHVADPAEQRCRVFHISETCANTRLELKLQLDIEMVTDDVKDVP